MLLSNVEFKLKKQTNKKKTSVSGKESVRSLSGFCTKLLHDLFSFRSSGGRLAAIYSSGLQYITKQMDNGTEVYANDGKIVTPESQQAANERILEPMKSE